MLLFVLPDLLSCEWRFPGWLPCKGLRTRNFPEVAGGPTHHHEKVNRVLHNVKAKMLQRQFSTARWYTQLLRDLSYH